MRSLLTLTAALIAGIVVLYKFNTMRQERQTNNTSTAAAKIWMASLSGMLALLLLTDPTSQIVSQTVGINNFSWYLAYLLGTASFYIDGALFLKEQKQRFLLLILLLAYIFYTLLFVFQIAHTTEWPTRSPRTWIDALFMTTFFGYGTLVTFMVFPYLMRFYRQEQMRPARLRAIGILGLNSTASACFILKLWYIWIAYLMPNTAIAKPLNQLALVAMAVTALGLGIVLLPHKLYIWFIDCTHLISKYRALNDLLYFQHYIHTICPSISNKMPSQWERVRHLDFYTYRAIINILDGRKLLVGYLNLPPVSPQNEINTANTLIPPTIHPDSSFQEVLVLHNLLQEGGQEHEYEKLIHNYQLISRQLQGEVKSS